MEGGTERMCEEGRTGDRQGMKKAVGKYSAMRDDKEGGKEDGRGRKRRKGWEECV